MPKHFSQYTETVRLLMEGSLPRLSQYFYDENLEKNWRNHNNWNGGIDFYNIVFNIPIPLYETLKEDGKIAGIEKEIEGYYEDTMRGGDESIQITDVVLRPSAELSFVVNEKINDTMWQPNKFRLFISHLSKYKQSAAYLKICLAKYGVDGFVAHEDIKPS